MLLQPPTPNSIYPANLFVYLEDQAHLRWINFSYLGHIHPHCSCSVLNNPCLRTGMKKNGLGRSRWDFFLPYLPLSYHQLQHWKFQFQGQNKVVEDYCLSAFFFFFFPPEARHIGQKGGGKICLIWVFEFEPIS